MRASRGDAIVASGWTILDRLELTQYACYGLYQPLLVGEFGQYRRVGPLVQDIRPCFCGIENEGNAELRETFANGHAEAAVVSVAGDLGGANDSARRILHG